MVSSKDEEFSVVVYKSREIFESSDLELIREYLRDRVINEEVDTGSDLLLDAVAAVCCMDDLQPWLISTCREEIYEGDMTIVMMHELPQDPLGAVKSLVDKEEVYDVLVAQCRPSDDDLAKAILKGVGGSEGFLHKKLIRTEEGFVIDSDNNHTGKLVDDIFARKKASTAEDTV